MMSQVMKAHASDTGLFTCSLPNLTQVDARACEQPLVGIVTLPLEFEFQQFGFQSVLTEISHCFMFLSL